MSKFMARILLFVTVLCILGATFTDGDSEVVFLALSLLSWGMSFSVWLTSDS